MVGYARAFGALLLLLLVALPLTPACQPRPSPQSASKTPLTLALPNASPALTEPQLPPGAQASSEQIPIGPSDATRGSPTAAVTIVGFFGLQCPFAARAQPALEQLEREYGSERVRVVFMHLPLPFHQQGRPSADAAQAVLALGGHRAFFAFVAEVYARQKELGPALVRDAAQKAGVDPKEVERISALPEIRAQPPEKPAPTAEDPSRGPAGAPIVIQMFADFQCPFCKKALPTLRELEQAFPKKIRIVWRNLPLEFHRHSRITAAAALEAFAQKGDAGFWKMHDALFEHQEDRDAFANERLEQYAREAGLDVARFRTALADGRHNAAIDRDLDVAQAAAISGTPSFIINGYYVSGAQPLAAFKKVACLALGQQQRTPRLRQ